MYSRVAVGTKWRNHVETDRSSLWYLVYMFGCSTQPDIADVPRQCELTALDKDCSRWLMACRLWAQRFSD